MRTALEQERIPRFPGLWSAYAAIAVLLVFLVNPPRWPRRRARQKSEPPENAA